jgi:hypothetical protein
MVGQRRIVTCSYRCKKPDGAQVVVMGVHTEWYLHAPGDGLGSEGPCIGTTVSSMFSSYKMREIYTPTGHESFDPAKSKSQQLRDWAKENCNCGK